MLVISEYVFPELTIFAEVFIDIILVLFIHRHISFYGILNNMYTCSKTTKTS